MIIAYAMRERKSENLMLLQKESLKWRIPIRYDICIHCTLCAYIFREVFDGYKHFFKFLSDQSTNTNENRIYLRRTKNDEAIVLAVLAIKTS